MPGNTFGNLFRVTTFGESHGPAIGGIVDGVPPGIPLDEADIQHDVDRRRTGQSRHTSQRRESDRVEILSGVFEGLTTGTPIGLLIRNEDARSKDYSEIKDKFRPGHADFTYFKKYGIRDYRGGGRSSARETAVRVAAGAIARKVLGAGITVRGALVQIGPLAVDRSRWDWDTVPTNSLWCPDPAKTAEWEAFLDSVRKDGSSVGAVVEVVAHGVPAGLGEPIFDKLDADIAKALMSIPAVKAVEIGAGAAAAQLTGPENADEMRRGRGRDAGLPRQQRRWHSGWHLVGAGYRGPFHRQADQFDSDAAPDGNPGRRGNRHHHQGPARPLRRHSRRTGRRSHAGHRAGRPLAASAGAVRRLISVAVSSPWN